MKRHFYIGLGLALLLAACSPAYTGLDGSIMYTNTNPDVAVVPNTGLMPMQSGVIYVNLDSDSNLRPRTRVNYVIYGDDDSAQVKRHAHVLFTEIIDRHQFQFMPETFSERNELGVKTVKIEGRSWTEHQRYENFEGDWFTRWWTMNDRNAPKTWIGKRWSRNEDPYTRTIVEYREPLPACASIEENQIMFIFNNVRINSPTLECKQEVDAVFARADAAFSIRRSSAMQLGSAAPANAMRQIPSAPSMNTTRHIGSAQITSQPMD
ncbi:MAG: DUF4851 domain-containing protein [Desulfovibrionaceae bacterium]|nr:DUF4851 domain-containing protein [Desulfovibrionaceae bacterium]